MNLKEDFTTGDEDFSVTAAWSGLGPEFTVRCLSPVGVNFSLRMSSTRPWAISLLSSCCGDGFVSPEALPKSKKNRPGFCKACRKKTSYRESQTVIPRVEAMAEDDFLHWCEEALAAEQSPLQAIMFSFSLRDFIVTVMAVGQEFGDTTRSTVETADERWAGAKAFTETVLMRCREAWEELERAAE